MTTIYTNYSAPAAFAVAASLAAANYDLTNTVYNSTTNKPADVLLEYTAAIAANSTGNKQVVLFLQASLDGTTWSAAPSSATDATHDTSLRTLGVIPTNGGANAETVRAQFSVAAASPGGILAPYWRVLVKNDCGVAMSSCAARTQEISVTAV